MQSNRSQTLRLTHRPYLYVSLFLFLLSTLLSSYDLYLSQLIFPKKKARIFQFPYTPLLGFSLKRPFQLNIVFTHMFFHFANNSVAHFHKFSFTFWRLEKIVWPPLSPLHCVPKNSSPPTTILLQLIFSQCNELLQNRQLNSTRIFLCLFLIFPIFLSFSFPLHSYFYLQAEKMKIID